MISELSPTFRGKRLGVGELRPSKRDRVSRYPIDPSVISGMAQLIELKREARYQFYTGFSFEVDPKSQNLICKIYDVQGKIFGYLKREKVPSCSDSAIIEKIRWDLALLLGDGDVHTPSSIWSYNFGKERIRVVVQVHQEGITLEKAYEQKINIPRKAMLRALLITIVYGGFDDHLFNQILKDDKIIFFDNVSSLSYGKGFLDWLSSHRFAFRPKILQFDEMDQPLSDDEIDFLKKEITKYIALEPVIRAYFARPDIQKLLSHLNDGLIHPEKVIEGMKLRCFAALEKLGLKEDQTPRDWVFQSFPLYRVAVAWMMAARKCNIVEAIMCVGYEDFNKKILRAVVSRKIDPSEVMKIALATEDIREIAVNALMLKEASQETLKKGFLAAFRFLRRHTEKECKDLVHTVETNQIQMENLLNTAEIAYKKMPQGLLNIAGLVAHATADKKLVFHHDQFHLPPIHLYDPFFRKNNPSKETLLYRIFFDELIDNKIAVQSCRLHEMGSIKAIMPNNSYKVFHIRDNTNRRFILAEKDAKGNVHSREIGLNLGVILNAKDKYQNTYHKYKREKVGEIVIDGVRYPVIVGECRGTYKIKVGKLETAPLFLEEMDKMSPDMAMQFRLLLELNTLHALVLDDSEKFIPSIERGQYAILQKPEASPLLFHICQWPNRFPNRYNYELIGFSNTDLRLKTEMGVTFTLDLETFRERLKTGIKLDGEA